MTTPKEMLSNVVQALRYLDSRLPNGSHVILTGLVDGRFLWDNLHDRYHPLGKFGFLGGVPPGYLLFLFPSLPEKSVNLLMTSSKPDRVEAI